MSFVHQQYAKKLVVDLHDQLTPSDVSVLYAIADLCHQNNAQCFAHYGKLANLAAVTERTARRSTAKLERLNIIATRRGSGSVPGFHFPVPVDFDEYSNSHLTAAGPAPRLTAQEQAKAAKEIYQKLSGDTGPFDDLDHQQRLTRVFNECANDEERMAIIKAQMKGLDPLELLFYPIHQRADIVAQYDGGTAKFHADLPYDPTVREPGVETPQNRRHYDEEA